jgi:hypothetical protein
MCASLFLHRHKDSPQRLAQPLHALDRNGEGVATPTKTGAEKGEGVWGSGAVAGTAAVDTQR